MPGMYDTIDAVTLVAGENLNGDLYKLVKIDNTGRAVLATAVTDVVVGILAEDPALLGVSGDDSTGRSVKVALLKGIVLAKALGTVTAGNLAIWGTGGLVTQDDNIAGLAANSFAIGVFRESGVANQIVEILAVPMTASAAA